MQDFSVRKFYSYVGPSYYLYRQAMVFNLYLDADGKAVGHYLPQVLEKFPQLDGESPERVVDLFCLVLIQVLQMDIGLWINRYDISRDGEEFVIAVEYLDRDVAEDSAHLVSEWFQALDRGGLE